MRVVRAVLRSTVLAVIVRVCTGQHLGCGKAAEIETEYILIGDISPDARAHAKPFGDI